MVNRTKNSAAQPCCSDGLLRSLGYARIVAVHLWKPGIIAGRCFLSKYSLGDGKESSVCDRDGQWCVLSCRFSWSVW
jgi:hypothetical protein